MINYIGTFEFVFAAMYVVSYEKIAGLAGFVEDCKSQFIGGINAGYIFPDNFFHYFFIYFIGWAQAIAIEQVDCLL